uniref:Uncharacterized protein n=1 Tax=Arundo donax TaxID=35708 RepID=A0A0A8YRT8_ARUDO
MVVGCTLKLSLLYCFPSNLWYILGRG